MAAAAPATEEASKVQASPSEPLEDKSGTVREVGGAATWSLSSCKPGTVL